MLDVKSTLGIEEVVEQSNGIKQLEMLPEDRTDFASLTDPGEVKRARNHIKRAMEGNYRPIPPREWMICPLCLEQIRMTGHTDSGAQTPYRAPESLVTHYKEHGGISEVARQMQVLPEQLPMNNALLTARFRAIGIRGAKKNG